MTCMIRDCTAPCESGWLFCAAHVDSFHLREYPRRPTATGLAPGAWVRVLAGAFRGWAGQIVDPEPDGLTADIRKVALDGGHSYYQCTDLEELIPGAGRERAPAARPFDDWHEDIGAVLWWQFPVAEPPYAGTPLDDDFPEYMTHWTPIVVPEAP